MVLTWPFLLTMILSYVTDERYRYRDEIHLQAGKPKILQFGAAPG